MYLRVCIVYVFTVLNQNVSKFLYILRFFRNRTLEIVENTEKLFNKFNSVQTRRLVSVQLMQMRSTLSHLAEYCTNFETLQNHAKPNQSKIGMFQILHKKTYF